MKSQGEPRLLLFSPDSRTLYFTTTLNHSVQAYSIPTAELLPSFSSHPSPPTALAISSEGNVLLSASPSPPTVYIQDRRWASNPLVNFHPDDTKSPVTCASFQDPEHDKEQWLLRFVLGFQDGSLVVYRLFLPSLSETNKQPSASLDGPPQLRVARLGAVRKLHKAVMGGIKAAEFLPCFKSRIVSIGHDGKCRLIDFDTKGRILRT